MFMHHHKHHHVHQNTVQHVAAAPAPVSQNNDPTGTILVILVIGGLLAVFAARASRRGRPLPRNFVSMGNITGKSKDEIVKVVGPPNSISTVAGGILYQWISTRGGLIRGHGSHYAILFDKDMKAIHYTHQFNT
jgi:hypothetical protein